MADEQELRRVNWNEILQFTPIFKGWRLSRDPSKIALAVAAIVLVFLFGWAMDKLWAISGSYAHPDEILAHASRLADSGKNFNQWKLSWEKSRVDRAAAILQEYDGDAFLNRFKSQLPAAYLTAFNKKLPGEIPQRLDSDTVKRLRGDGWSALLGKANDAFEAQARLIRKGLDDIDDEVISQRREQLKNDPSKSSQDRDLELDALNRDYLEAWHELSKARATLAVEEAKVRGRPIFASFWDWQRGCLGNALAGVQRGNFTDGLAEYWNFATASSSARALPVESATALPVLARPAEASGGFLFWVLMMVEGFCWIFAEHTIFAIALTVWTLVVWAVFGGAIHRIAALHAARDEKISIRQALKFSISKIGCFITAPLLPLGVILAIGLVMSVAALVGNIPGVGEIIVGALFFLAIIGGALIAFMLVGLAGGGVLMAPTIAVEGSDSLDAMSRSFSYVFSQPWRAIVYGLIALVYGTITYLFVRLFAYLALAATYLFVGLGFFTGGKSLGADASTFDVLWSGPSFGNLLGTFNWSAMNGWECIGAWFIRIYVFLVAAIVAGYLLSYFVSASTTIYLLLRRRVDATEIDDVWVEEEPAVPEGPHEDEAAPAPAAPADPAAPPASGPTEPPPAAPASGPAAGV